MKCKQIHRQLTGNIEKTLDPVIEKKVTEHLSTCSKCFFLYERLGETLSMAGKQSRLSVDPFFYTRLMARMENEQAPVARKRIISLQPVFMSFLILLSVAFGIALGGGANLLNPTSSSQIRIENIQSYSKQLGFNEMDQEYLEQTLLLNNDKE